MVWDGTVYLASNGKLEAKKEKVGEMETRREDGTVLTPSGLFLVCTLYTQHIQSVVDAG